jgi:hypothetical protein
VNGIGVTASSRLSTATGLSLGVEEVIYIHADVDI